MAKPNITSILTDSSGYYNTSTIDKNKQVSAIYYMIDELAERLNNPSTFRDAYFCPFPLKSKKRNKDNVIPSPLMVVDVDARDTSPEGIQKTADKLKVVFEALKPAAVVFTGGGFHVYFKTDRPVRPEDRRWLLDRIDNLSPNLVKDRGCTINPACLFRIPGGRNFKFDPPRIVKLVMLNPNNVLALPAVNQSITPITKPVQLNQGLSYAGPASDMDVLLAGCKQLQHQRDNPNDVDYKSWLNMLTVARVCANGVDKAHMLSKGYDKYDPVEVDRKLATLHGGPATCATFDADKPGLCDGCPHHAKVKSPAVLKHHMLAPVQVQGAKLLPDGYSHENGKTVLTDPESGAKTIVCDVPVWIEFWEKDKPNHNKQLVNTFTIRSTVPGPDGQETAETTYTSSVYTNKKHLAVAIDLRTDCADPKAFIRMLATMAIHASRTMQPVETVSNLGWRLKGEYAFYTPFKKLVAATDDEPAREETIDALTPDLELIAEGRERTTEGSMADVVQGVQFAATKYPHIYLMLLLSLAAPLVSRLNIGVSPLVNFRGKTGSGKSLGLKLFESVWWKADHTTLVSSNDTPNSMMKVMSALRNLPVAIDEVTTIKDEIFHSSLYDMAQGHSRKRLSQNGELATGHSSMGWSTIICTASNKAIGDVIDANKSRGSIWEALKARCLDVDCDYTMPPTDARYMADKLLTNHGLLGESFMRSVMEVEGLAKVLDGCHKKALETIEVEVGGDISLMRFRASVMGLVSFVNLMLTRAGIVPAGSFAAVKQLLIDEARTAHVDTKYEAVAIFDAIGDYIRECGHLIIEPVGGGIGRTMRASGTPQQREYLRGRKESDFIYLASKPLNEYLRNLGFKQGDLTRAIDPKGTVRNVRKKVTLHKDTQFQSEGGQSLCVEIYYPQLMQLLGRDPLSPADATSNVVAFPSLDLPDPPSL